jgi:CDP-glycerol glycerophosphotransferase
VPSKLKAILRKIKRQIKQLFYKVCRIVLPIRQRTFFFQSYLGQSISCSPRAISIYVLDNLPNSRVVWSVNNLEKQAPSGSKLVKKGSFAHYYYLASAKFIVANTGLSDGFTKREKQIHMQTWHGSTLKRVGRDKGIPDEKRVIRLTSTDPKKLTGFARRVSMWDYLIAPNSLSAHSFQTAWRFGGEMLHIGYPRNDNLFNPTWVLQQRQKVRDELNIPEGNLVALWAPTWRENAERIHGKYTYEIPFDLQELMKLRNVTILAKMHYRVASQISDKGTKPSFINVSNWDEINDLFPASDLLISDFSATIPDYANTGKPIIFFSPDYEEYMKTRGTYVDIETEGPGPLIKTSGELFDLLQDLSWVQEYEARYQKFVQIYGEYEDGHATEKAVQRLMNSNPPLRGGVSF